MSVNKFIDTEIWKDITGYDGLYQVSNFGRVKNINRVRHSILIPHIMGNYYCVILCKNTKKETKSIHRLKATAFILNPENKPQVNHIDGNKHNNDLSNLEWVSSSENCIHAYKLGLAVPPWIGKKGSKHNTSRNVLKYDRNNKFIKSYGSITEAANDVNGIVSHITEVCGGRRKTANGFIWKYKTVNHEC